MADLGGHEQSPVEVKRALAQLAELMVFRERFNEDPTAALDSHGLVALPPQVVEALAALSPEELAVFAKVQRKLAEVPGSEEIGIFF